MDYKKERLQERIYELEEKIEHLRVSRRVLMNLLEKAEKEKDRTIITLEKALEKERSNKRRLIRNHPNFKLLHVIPIEEHVARIELGMPDDFLQDESWIAEKELMLNNPVERIKVDIEKDDAEQQILNASPTLQERIELRWGVK